MSKHNRTSRRRRIALGLGATGSGLLAAAFMPMGIALADNVSDAAAAAATAATTGNFPTDTETVPDPFSDFTGYPDVSSSGTTLAEGYLDQQLNIDNPFLAAQIDYDIDTHQAFSFGALDGIGTMPAGYVGPEGTTSTTDLDPFEDAFTNNGGTSTAPLADGMTQTDAASYDYALNHVLQAGQVAQLDGIADGTTTSVTGTATEPTTPDPFLDALQATDSTATATQIAQANYADYLLDTQNPTYAASLDTAVEAAVKAGTLSATSAGGGTGDENAIADAFTNAGVSPTLAASEGGALDAALPTVANGADPVVDSLGTVPTVPDLDPVADFVQIFDPNAFTVSATGVETPTDFVGQLAVFDDTFLQAIGLAAPLDQFVDLFTGSATTTGTDAMTGILGLFGL